MEPDQVKQLHLGCGETYIPGFFHVDVLDAKHIDLQADISNLSMFSCNSIETIYASHVLEHFGRHDYLGVLAEWFRVLKPNGTLRIAVPDFEACVKLYLSDSEITLSDILGLVCGGQRDSYDFHKMIFDQSSLVAALEQVGFSSVSRWDWRKTPHSHIDDYSQAYLPHMNKDTGTLVSLNLIAVK